MKFTYPYRIFIVGLLFLLFIFSYGIVVLSVIFDEGHLNFMIIVLFTLVALYFSQYYYKKIQYYMNKFLKIENHTLILHDQNLEDVIEESSLDVIFLAKHMQNFKVHRVIHIFKSDGTYYYITNDINHFNDLIKTLETTFPSKYYITRKLIRGFHDISKGFLFCYL